MKKAIIETNSNAYRIAFDPFPEEGEIRKEEMNIINELLNELNAENEIVLYLSGDVEKKYEQYAKNSCYFNYFGYYHLDTWNLKNEDIITYREIEGTFFTKDFNWAFYKETIATKSFSNYYKRMKLHPWIVEIYISYDEGSVRIIFQKNQGQENVMRDFLRKMKNLEYTFKIHGKYKKDVMEMIND